jgi:hypothetical protein
MRRRTALPLLLSGIGMLAALARAQGADTQAIEATNQAFYAALSSRDLAAMRGVWANRPYVVNIGPRSRTMDVGYEAVIKYWESALDFFSRLSAAPSNTRFQRNGDLAWAVGNETAQKVPR